MYILLNLLGNYMRSNKIKQFLFFYVCIYFYFLNIYIYFFQYCFY